MARRKRRFVNDVKKEQKFQVQNGITVVNQGVSSEARRKRRFVNDVKKEQKFHVQNGKTVVNQDVSSEEESGMVLEEGVSSYNALLQSLQAKGGSFADAYARRQRDELGESSSDEEDEVNEAEGTHIDGQSEAEIGLLDNADENGSKATCVLTSAEESEEVVKVDAVDEEETDEDEPENDINNEDLDKSDDEPKIGMDGERIDSSTQAGACSEVHNDYVLGRDEELLRLLKGKDKFECKTLAAGLPGATWICNRPEFPKHEKMLEWYGVRKRLQSCWLASHQNLSLGDFVSEQQSQFFSLCNSYFDILHSQKREFKGNIDSTTADFSIMDAYLLHILNHIMKTRDLVTKNNEKLHHTLSKEASSEAVFDPPRDQGFTRPKVLILLPLRSSALKLVKRMLDLTPSVQKASVEHKQRFLNEFGIEEDSDSEVDQMSDGKDGSVIKEKVSARDSKSSKPSDFRELFSGNNDDHFRIGVKFTRKAVKLYSDFYSSDIIIASPVGLVTRIEEAESDKDKDIDFLSSIEITVVDQTEVILMQNWAHVVSIFEHLNKIPEKQHGTDFMRIREWYLNGHARHYRQSIILGCFPDAGVNALFHRVCANHAGKVKLQSHHKGVLSKVLLQVRQVYERIVCNTVADVDDTRFEFFVKQVFPRMRNSLEGGVMIFTRSYFDFVRIRNFLKAENSSFCLLGEYTKQSDISRARTWFYHGERKILLYTERAHFFHRYRVRGVKNLIFYSLPDHAPFYVELLNMLEGTENPSCTVLFSRFDNLQLERIVGTPRAKKILGSTNRLFMFC